ncbi:MAG: hypothetical protein ABSG57_12245 [Candidatus Bathyarchaeia archaeon]
MERERERERTIFQCELCGHSYADLETAERCEQYCYSHGRPSAMLTEKYPLKLQRNGIGTPARKNPRYKTN